MAYDTSVFFGQSICPTTAKQKRRSIHIVRVRMYKWTGKLLFKPDHRTFNRTVTLDSCARLFDCILWISFELEI